MRRAIALLVLAVCAAACNAFEPKVGPLRSDDEDAGVACAPSPAEDAAEYGGGAPAEDDAGPSCGDDS